MGQLLRATNIGERQNLYMNMKLLFILLSKYIIQSH